jgi:trehalose/maltose hydrolase-like predicted phosphorylase
MTLFKTTTWIALLMLLCAIKLHAQSKPNVWTISAKNINTNNYYGVTVANGMIGLVSSAKPLQMKTLILNGVYDAYGKSEVPRIMKGFNFANIALSINGDTVDVNNVTNLTQQLDMKHAVITTHFNLSNEAVITYRVRALRQLPFSGLIEVKIKAKKPLDIKAGSAIEAPSIIKHIRNNFSQEGKIVLLTSSGQTPTGRYTLAASNAFIFKGENPEVSHTDSSGRRNEAAFSKHIPEGQTFQFWVIGSETSTVHFVQPVHEAQRLSIYAKLQGIKKLIRDHNQAWKKLWSSRIIVEGNTSDQRDINLALYNLYSFIRKGSGYSIPPMGLSSTGYNGHIFWDAEIWMFPSLLALHPELARSMLDYRYNQLQAAKEKAWTLGYNGAMFPWESAATGQEETPVWALTGQFEQHITADVAIACWNYFRVTHDKNWLKKKGYPIIKAAAEFWVSRVSRDSSGKYHINNVVGADEFAENINDDAFTNGAAKKALQFAAQAAKELGKSANPKWNKIAKNIVIDTFDNGVIKEYGSYNGGKIKQADVSLLSYPLNIITKPARIQKDLQYYQSRIAHGPAMSYSIFSLLWARLGNKSKAYHLFHKGYKPNEKPPFGALAETAGGTNPYFCTGAGGMLQAVLFGFGGLNITNQGIKQIHSVLPKQWKSLKITGVGKDNKTFFRK